MISQVTIAITVFLAVVLFLLPRQYFIIPFIVCACFIPADQRLIVMDLDFTPLRILVVIGVLRLLLKGETIPLRWNVLDKLILAWAVVGACVFVIQWMDAKMLVFKCGILFDVIGMYWLFRQSLECWDDVALVFKVLAICCILLAPFVAFERTTGKNLFDVFGKAETQMRENEYRCQATFSHSIILGSFFATLVPCFIALAKTRRWRYISWFAAGVSVLAVFASASSTPLFVLAFMLMLMLSFHLRRFGKYVLIGVFIMALGLHIMMEAPIWHLISRVSAVAGSTGWHRYVLIDNAVSHFHEWAMIGCKSTEHSGLDTNMCAHLQNRISAIALAKPPPESFRHIIHRTALPYPRRTYAWFTAF
ncbi:MAG TPA: hypothetical protein ENH94_02915 [Phycisphaerales bacterium]|nr:hypothetical protein [Phycisphaerales bacterium]